MELIGMRRSKKEVALNRQRALDAGALLIRERGIDGARVADIMDAAGLTHGAFYTYFESKDELVREALALAFRNTVELWGAGRSDDAIALDGILDTYLSMDHVRSVGTGCAAAALAGELGRSDAVIRTEAAKGVRHMVDTLLPSLGGRSRQRREQLALGTVATMVGALLLARLEPDQADAQAMVDAAKAMIRGSV